MHVLCRKILIEGYSLKVINKWLKVKCFIGHTFMTNIRCAHCCKQDCDPFRCCKRKIYAFKWVNSS